MGMHLPDVSLARRAPGADRPDGLIGNHDIVGIPVRHRARELAGDDIERLAGIALRLGFADADDRRHARPAGGFRFGAHHRVGLASVKPALGVADDDGACPRVLQHFCRDFSGMRA
jgi:hypothetical protein